MTVTHVIGDIYAVDPHLMGTPGALNLYIIDAPRPAVVDTGSANSPPKIYDALDDLGIDREDVAAVLVTHVHLDHAGGAGHLAETLPSADFYIHERGLPFLTDNNQLDRLKQSVDRAMGVEDAYGEPKLVPEARCFPVSGGETVDLADRELELIDAPGHAPHHFAAFDPQTEAMFSIDAAGMYLGGEMRPTTPPPGFDLEANLETVDTLRAYDPSKNLYGHVGPGGNNPIREYDRYERMLPEWVERITELRGTHGDDIATIVDELGREWQSPTVQRDVAGVLKYLDETER